MSTLKVVSRKDLYNSDDNEDHFEDDINDDVVLEAPMEFEFIDVVNEDKKEEVEDTKEDQVDDDNKEAQSEKNEAVEEDNKEEEFEYFPLFSLGGDENTANSDTTTESCGNLMKISLKEPVIEYIKQERPKEYYFTNNDDERKHEFEVSAITAEVIISSSNIGYSSQKFSQYFGKVIDINEYNKKIDEERIREKILKNRRPSKKQRLARKLGKEREEERKQKAKEIKKAIKKKFHKRGGKKNKKVTKINPLENAGAIESKPKFRTE